MRALIAPVLLILSPVGVALSCSSTSYPALRDCCAVGVFCFCGSSASGAGPYRVQVSSGAMCTVTNLADGGGDAMVYGETPEDQADCPNPVGN